MKPFTLILVVGLFLILSVSALTAQSVPAGLGASTLTCLDRDGDGYGVGTGCLGPDADDTDITVHTGAQGITKYGSLTLFLNHLGYTATRIWYISNTGNDGTCAVNNIALPCATFMTGVRSHVVPDDVVIWRAGTYSENIFLISGTLGHQTVYMGYPGEHVNVGGASNSLLNAADLHYSTIDGFSFDGFGYIAIGTGGVNPTVSTFFNVTIRHIHGNATSSSLGDIYGFEGLTNLVIEDSVFHDNGFQHGIYIGAHNLPGSNVTLQRLILYRNNWNGLHWNGRCTSGCLVTDVISYSNGISGLDFEMGYSHSTISNNLIFNNAKQLTFFNYESGQCPGRPGYVTGQVNICPWDQNFNVIENNTIYGTGNDPLNNPTGGTGPGCSNQPGTYDCNQPAIGVSNIVDPANGSVGDLGNNTFRNNIVINYGGNGPSVIRPPVQYGNHLGGALSNCDATCTGWLASSTFSNNIFFMNNGNVSTSILMALPNFYTCSTARFVTSMSSCTNGDPLLVAASPALWNSTNSFKFKLQSGSPALGAGTNVGAPGTDIIGTARPSPPSIGAYESSSSGNPPPSGNPPTVPTGLTATSTSSSQINLSWSASTDSTGTLAGYKVYRDGVQIATTAATTYQDTGLSASIAYTYNVAAYDTSGNASAQSAPASATTGPSRGSYPVGWTELPNTRLVDVCPGANGNWTSPQVSRRANYDFATNCHTLVDSDWSGGAGDTRRDRLIIWGGGHSDYAGNEVYSLNLLANPVSLTRLNDPSTPAVFDRNAGCGKITSTTFPFQANPNSNDNWAMFDGRPNTRHDTGGLAYMPSVDQMYLFNGGVACGNAPHYFDTWWLDMANISSSGTGGWTQKDPLNGVRPFNGTSTQGGQFFSATAWDPNTNTVAMWTPNEMFKYDPATNTLTRLNNNVHLALSSSVTIDPKRKLFIAVGVEYAGSGATYNPNYNVQLFCYSSSPCVLPSGTLAANAISDVTTAVVNSNTCGPVIYSPTQNPGWDPTTGPINQPEPGIAYDPVIDRTVLWPNHGSTVYLFNPDTLTCTTQSFTGPVPPSGPGAVPSQMSGTFGRFRYFPDLDIFALVSDARRNAYVLRLNNGSGDGTGGPSVSVTSPTSGTTVSSNVTLSATASDSAGITSVQFLVDGIAMGPALVAPPYSAVWSSAQASNGTHTITAEAIDAAGKSATSAAVAVIVSNSSTVSPSVSVTSPTSGTTVSSNVTLSAIASDSAGITSVQFLVDGIAMGPALVAAPYSAVWNSTQASNGTHTIAAKAIDAAGKRGTSAAVAVIVSHSSTVSPSVSVTSPTSGTTVSSNVTLSAIASDSAGITSVQFLVDGIAMGPALVAAPYSAVWSSTQASNGTHTIAAKAIDAAGKRGTSAAVAIIVSNANGQPGGSNANGQPGGPLFPVNMDSSTVFSVQLDDLATIFACPECYFQSAGDIMSGQALEVRVRSGSSSPKADKVILRQGSIEGQVASAEGSSFVFVPSNPIFLGQSLTVLTGSATVFVNFPPNLPMVVASEKIAVRGLLLRSAPGGPTVLAKQVSLISHKRIFGIQPVRPRRPVDYVK